MGSLASSTRPDAVQHLTAQYWCASCKRPDEPGRSSCRGCIKWHVRVRWGNSLSVIARPTSFSRLAAGPGFWAHTRCYPEGPTSLVQARQSAPATRSSSQSRASAQSRLTCPSAAARSAMSAIRSASLHSTKWLSSKTGSPQTRRYQLLPTYHLSPYIEQGSFSV